MISKNTRPYHAGYQVGEGLRETANILYLKDNRMEYLQGLVDKLSKELQEVKGEDITNL